MHSKLISNVIAFENPTPKIYDILPPPREDFDEVLAVMFSGSTKPTDEDYQRALLLIRRNVVASAIKWLILNHADYNDVVFCMNNLDGYSEEAPIVAVEFFEKGSTKNAEGVSIYDDLEDFESGEGDCVFTVHGITGEALKHMTSEHLWNNPQLYPKMFPWLFPYGLGGFGSINHSSNTFSDASHVKFMMLYHDKRFQLDQSFPFVAFSHR
ncbi:hypothetical protein BT96DRAFT_1084044 [Gymnopus androsaceus JB14]|uniref:DUF6570 domain-containing protein n=1 Tax=Gymnopus androsaceus JB14 TaxID=1447944 RepID=A0A6A4GM42_9AGAR|nr:hypothetical protein BT96DRAFT_1084044 [Gymnopus androsaceus JB14]